MEVEAPRPPVAYISDAENAEIADRVFARNEAVLERLAVAEDALPPGWKSLGNRRVGWEKTVGAYVLQVSPSHSGIYKATAEVPECVPGLGLVYDHAYADTLPAAFTLAVDLARAMSQAVLPPFEEGDGDDPTD